MVVDIVASQIRHLSDLENLSESEKKRIVTQIDRIEPLLNLDVSKDIGSTFNRVVDASVTRIGDAEPGDVHGIAAEQIRLLSNFYRSALSRTTMIAASVGLALFIGAGIFMMTELPQTIATISIVAGAVVEVVAGINLYLYNKVASQTAELQLRLEQTQRFLLANTICEHLDDSTKQTTRASLVATIAELELSR
jgi:hypothetical protein